MARKAASGGPGRQALLLERGDRRLARPAGLSLAHERQYFYASKGFNEETKQVRKRNWDKWTKL
jgi:hypothetical protein